MSAQPVDPFEADIRNDPCPECPAGATEPCRSRDGRKRSESHRGRERIWSVRRAREIAGVDWNSPTWGSNAVHVSTAGDLAGERRDGDE